MAAKKQLKKPAPGATKVNKNAKPKEVAPRIENDEEYRCSCCGHKYKKQESNFNVSKSPIYNGNNGYMTICKRCVAQLYEQYVTFYSYDEDAAAERICQMTDMYFDDVAWGASRKISADRNRMSVYVSKLNLNQSASKGTTYSDTLVRRWEAQVENAENINQVKDNEDIDVDIETVHRFGLGFTDGEYGALQAEYDSWVQKYGVPMDKRQEELYTTICYLKLNLQKSVQNDASGVGSLANSYRGFIEAATTEIEDRQKKAEAEIETNPLGVWIREIEQYTPAEFYQDKKLYADFDSLREYITRFMTRPLKNLLTGSKDMDKEFNLSDSEE